jgi:hypothetical protein
MIEMLVREKLQNVRKSLEKRGNTKGRREEERQLPVFNVDFSHFVSQMKKIREICFSGVALEKKLVLGIAEGIYFSPSIRDSARKRKSPVEGGRGF